MPEQNLNPDALKAAADKLREHHIPLEGLGIGYDEAAELAVATYLAALPAQPDTVNSVEELDALPCASVVLNGVTAFQKYGAREPFDWSADGRWYDSTQVELPARVLYRPTEESSDGR